MKKQQHENPHYQVWGIWESEECVLMSGYILYIIYQIMSGYILYIITLYYILYYISYYVWIYIIRSGYGRKAEDPNVISGPKNCGQ